VRKKIQSVIKARKKKISVIHIVTRHGRNSGMIFFAALLEYEYKTYLRVAAGRYDEKGR